MPDTGTKIISLNNLCDKIPRLKAAGKKIVFTNGCFDILHYGHVQYLERAKKDRTKVLAALESVNYVVLFNQDTPLKAITAIKPDVLVKGADWKKGNIVGADFVKSYGGRIITIKLAKGRSTTNIIKKINSYARCPNKQDNRC